MTQFPHPPKGAAKTVLNLLVRHVENLEIKMVFSMSSKHHVMILLPLLFLRSFCLLSFQTQARAIKSLLCERLSHTFCASCAVQIVREVLGRAGVGPRGPRTLAKGRPLRPAVTATGGQASPGVCTSSFSPREWISWHALGLLG